MMPVRAPAKFSRFQKRLRIMTGPNAAPNTPHALETRSMMEPAPGSIARIRASRAMIRTTRRLVQIISSFVAWFLRIRGLYTSLEKEDAAESSWLSAVDMDAARIAESRMPEITDGNSLRTMLMNTRLLPEIVSSKPRNNRPMTPTSTAKIRISVVQVIPIFAERFRDFWLSTDMKRMMICGMPK